MSTNMDIVTILNISLILIVILIFVLAIVGFIIWVRIRKSKEKKEQQENIQVASQKNQQQNLITRTGKSIDSIYKFMEFDRIVDSMIVRKNSKQYVMVIECKGINYDLLSEDEKNAVELGFIETLNTLRFPIQLYVQTRTLNLSNLLKEYKKRTDDVQSQIDKLNVQISEARARGDNNLVSRLRFERKRKQNILEYGESIENYTEGISDSRNILQQKTYVVVSYYPSEYGDLSKYSVDEVDDIVFSELYTRCQTLIRAMLSSEVTGRVLDSEELAELLYVAYNRDEAEKYTLSDALDSEYDRLYSTAKDVLEERKERIEEQIENDAAKVASKSIIKADIANREKRVKARAQEMVDEYKGELSKPLYEETKNQIENANIDELISDDENKRTIRKKA